MRRLNNILILAFLPVLLFATSCAKDAKGDWYNPSGGEFGPGDYADFLAILTVKKTPTDSVYFQLDDETTIYASNFQKDFTRMERIFCDITVYNTPAGRFNYTGIVNWLEPIDEGQVTSDSSIKGDLGLDIEDDWMTSVEDGYLTVHYNTWWGHNPVLHSFYLITGTDPSDPYTLLLVQKADGDKKDEEGDALVCFDINTLPDTGDEYKELKLKWTTCGGTAAEKTFRFKTRK